MCIPIRAKTNNMIHAHDIPIASNDTGCQKKQVSKLGEHNSKFAFGCMVDISNYSYGP